MSFNPVPSLFLWAGSGLHLLGPARFPQAGPGHRSTVQHSLAIREVLFTLQRSERLAVCREPFNLPAVGLGREIRGFSHCGQALRRSTAPGQALIKQAHPALTTHAYPAGFSMLGFGIGELDKIHAALSGLGFGFFTLLSLRGVDQTTQALAGPTISTLIGL